jgi:hypothetical protein
MKIQGKQLADTLRSESAPFDTIYTDRTIGDLNGAIRFTALNNTGSTIGAYKVVYINDVSGNTPTIALADADTASMPAFGLTATQVTTGNEVDVITFGNLKGVDTSLLSVGDVLYVSTTPGEYTTTPPSGSSSKLQNIGMVVKSDSNGIIKVGGAGRSAATPNLDEGHFFLGNASNQSVQSAYQLPTSVGTNGQVLTSNGTDLTFQDVSSGSDLTSVSSDITPATANTYSLGSATSEWSDLYLGDSSRIYFGNDQDVFLEHDPDAGLILDMSLDPALTPRLTIKNANSGIATGGEIEFLSETTSPAANDIIASLSATANNSASTLHEYTSIRSKITNSINNVEAAGLYFYTAAAGYPAGNPATEGLTIEGNNSGHVKVDLPLHDGSTSGLTLGGTLVKATASELNVLDVSSENPSDDNVLTYTSGNGLHWAPTSSGSELTYTATTATTLNAALNTHYFLNTSSATLTINLPASPSVGDVVVLLPRYNALQATINASTGELVCIAGVSGSASSKEIFIKAGKAFKIIYGTIGSSNQWITEADQIQMISSSGSDLASALYWRGGFIYSTSTTDQVYTLPNVDDVADGAYVEMAWLATSYSTDPDGVDPNSNRRSFTVTFNSDSGGNDIYKGGYAAAATNTYTFSPGGIVKIIKRADKFYILSPSDTHAVHSIPRTAIVDYQYNVAIYSTSFTAKVNTIYNVNASSPITVTLPDPYEAQYGDTIELHLGFNDNSNTTYLTINAGGSGRLVTGRNWADVNGSSDEVTVPILHGTVKAIKVLVNSWLLLTSGSEISTIKNINTASTTTYTLTGSQGFTHIVDTAATGGNTTLYLPVAYLKNATTPIVIKIIDDTYDVIVSRAQSSSNTIDGETSITFSAGGGKKYLKFVPYENGKYAIFSGY